MCVFACAAARVRRDRPPRRARREAADGRRASWRGSPPPGAITATERDERAGATSTPSSATRQAPPARQHRGARARRRGRPSSRASPRAATLTGPRLVPLWLTLERNREYWTTHATGPTHAPRSRFPGSQLVWQYFPGQGLQFHPLANFAQAQRALVPSATTAAGQLLDELLRAARPARRRRRLGVLLRLRRRPAAVGLAASPRAPASRRSPASASGSAARTRCCRSPSRRSACSRRRTPDGRARADRRRRRTTRCTRSRRTCASSTASCRRSSASTTSRKIAGDADAQRALRRGRARRAARGADATTPAPGRCTRAARASTSPTSPTTSCCARSCTACARAPQEPVYCDTELQLRPVPDRAAGDLAARPRRCAAARSARCSFGCRRSRASGCGSRATARPVYAQPAGRGRPRKPALQLAGAAQGGRLHVAADGGRPGGERRRRAEGTIEVLKPEASASCGR